MSESDDLMLGLKHHVLKKPADLGSNAPFSCGKNVHEKVLKVRAAP
jgi:hypothetical protein